MSNQDPLLECVLGLKYQVNRYLLCNRRIESSPEMSQQELFSEPRLDYSCGLSFLKSQDPF